MVRIRNTAPDEKPTRALYDADLLGDAYEGPPGIVFNEQDGTVAQVRQEVVDDVLAAFDHFERVDAAAASGSDDDAQPDDQHDDADVGDDEDAGGDT